MHVCICICIYISTWIYILYIYTYNYVYLYIYIHIHIYIYIYIYTYTYIYMCVYTHFNTYLCVYYVCACTHPHRPTHICKSEKFSLCLAVRAISHTLSLLCARTNTHACARAHTRSRALSLSSLFKRAPRWLDWDPKLRVCRWCQYPVSILSRTRKVSEKSLIYDRGDCALACPMPARSSNRCCWKHVDCLLCRRFILIDFY